MKKILNSLAFFFKVFVLVLLLVFGWVFINVTNLIKGKKSTDGNSGDKNIFGPNWADADAPPSPSPGPSTPFIAYYDGKEYKLENDILFGRPKSYHHNYDIAKSLYEDGRVSPDLYKITAPIKPFADKLLFQIQEIEPEESYFNWLGLERVVHSLDTEVIVDSEYKKFYVINKAKLEKKIHNPTAIIDRDGEDFTKEISGRNLIWQYAPTSKNNLFLDKDGRLEIIFTGLNKEETPYLLVKSWYRNWVFGNTGDLVGSAGVLARSFFKDPRFLRIPASILALFGAFFIHQKTGIGAEALASFPLFTGFVSHSLIYEYCDRAGEYQRVTITGIRAWKYNTEFIEFPKEAVLDSGELRLRVSATKKHALGFVGVIQEKALQHSSDKDYSEEKLSLRRAYHNRLNREVGDELSKEKQKEYVQTIPGDTIDLEFSTPKMPLEDGFRETYLIRSSGFYTSLRPENQKLAGNWQERISEEAKSRLASLKPLKNYQ